jgi:NADPH-dependent 2,4-dienoyl-CoA reductase/sulfur reductase-like enzyme/nitrite reductase/ring-hydroxylating ferredoxin subunit
MKREGELVGEAASASGPDFSKGIGLGEIPSEGTIAGRVGDDPILLSRLGGELFAIGASCTHYGGNLAEGVAGNATVRCPLHHACFDLRTGVALRAPALDPVDCWKVEVENDRAFVREKVPVAESVERSVEEQLARIVIVGGGAAGLACAHELRQLGYSGEITILSADRDPPCDRPNLSKDYLAGTAPEEWLWLRGDGWYSDNRIDLRLSTEVRNIDPAARIVHCASGEEFPFDRLLIATGAEPNRLDLPGFDGPKVHQLRSVNDARSIASEARPGARAVIIGASFIALEAAAALRKRNVDIDIVSVEEVPLEHVFGKDVGRKLQALHEKNGVRFHLSSVVSGFDGDKVELGGGRTIPADFVLVAIGVRPRTAVATSAGVAVDKGVLVNSFLETSVPGIYAAGDIASYPDPISTGRARIEHWVVAERQGQVAAANMLGKRETFSSAPFFWTEQYGISIRYVGRASGWDAVTLEGDIESGSMIARYFSDGAHCATATIGRDRENLEDELELEQRALISSV